jgi:dihydroorotase
VTTKVRISGGRIIDPASGRDEIGDLLIEGKTIVKEFSQPGKVKDFNAGGCLVTPGLIDAHCHLREPGREDKETIFTGARAAAVGGFTTVVAMANTNPPVDCQAVASYVRKKSAKAVIEVKTVGAVTKGLAGNSLSEMFELYEAGVVGYSDDGEPVQDSALMRKAMEYSLATNLPIISHCEDKRLSARGVVHEGYYSTVLGLPPIPAAAEEVALARDVILSELTGAKLHIAHVSTAGSVEIVRWAKSRGINVTAEVTPHHLVLTDQCLANYDTNLKVNPPLRSDADRRALVAAIIDGTIDAIATDHAPHTLEEKEQEFETAPFGIVGLETTLPLLLSELAGEGLSMLKLIEKLTIGPARIFGIEGGSLAAGSQADVLVLDHKAKVEVDVNKFYSKGRNTPFQGWKLKGQVKWLFKEGKLIVENGRLKD